MTDNEILVELAKAILDESHTGHGAARAILNREHFRLLYQRNPKDIVRNPEAGKAIFDAACEKFGSDVVRVDTYKQKGGGPDFPVLTYDGRITSSLLLSDTLGNLPVAAVDFVFIHPRLRRDAETWLRENREKIISAGGENHE